MIDDSDFIFAQSLREKKCFCWCHTNTLGTILRRFPPLYPLKNPPSRSHSKDKYLAGSVAPRVVVHGNVMLSMPGWLKEILPVLIWFIYWVWFFELLGMNHVWESFVVRLFAKEPEEINDSAPFPNLWYHQLSYICESNILVENLLIDVIVISPFLADGDWWIENQFFVSCCPLEAGFVL